MTALVTLPPETCAQLKTALKVAPFGFKSVLGRLDFYYKFKSTQDNDKRKLLLKTVRAGTENFPSAKADPEGAFELFKLLGGFGTESEYKFLKEVAFSFSQVGDFEKALEAALSMGPADLPPKN